MDNDARVLEGMRGLLCNWGCRVVAAATHEAALREVKRMGREARPELIISDYHLADRQSRIAAITKLREVYGAVPAFVMSGDTAPERLREARESALSPPVQAGASHHATSDGEPMPGTIAKGWSADPYNSSLGRWAATKRNERLCR
jgi:CheY-like chemotaxis protein